MIKSMMLEVLRDPVWQGIGVFVAVISALIAVIGLRHHRKNVRYEEGYAERQRRFTEVVSRLQELLTENELALQLWANPSGGYQEEQGEDAKKSYNTLLCYYRANTIW